ncbi:MAG: response regulator [Pedosphaera sp.]|nr:response regulator [Pedosphaera sp.]
MRSTPGQGATFDLYFRTTNENAAKITSDDDTTAVKKHGECVMVVDDEAILARALASVLGRLGYRPVIFSSSREALERLRNAPEYFLLMITDITMLDLNGIEPTIAVKTVSPGLPVILVSGDAARIDEDRARLLGADSFLPKPYAMLALGKAVSRSLRRGGQPKLQN